MKLLIVSGLSGAGKTVALHSLEDLGAYCIDNLPLNLLPVVAEQSGSGNSHYLCMAIGVDARSLSPEDIPGLLTVLQNKQFDSSLLFLEADTETLIKRYSETRRRHPLSSSGISLAEALSNEKHLMAPLAHQADIRIDTSHMHLHQLRDLIRVRLNLGGAQHLSLLFQSFGFKHGLPQDADFIFDVRCLPNPHWKANLRPLTGKDKAVQLFLEEQPGVYNMYEDIRRFVEKWVPQFEADNRSYLTVAIGCTGGRHRSVYISEKLLAYFTSQRKGVLLRHRELL